MASTRIREAREGDCADILRMIRVKPAGWNTECRGAGSGVVGAGEVDRGVYLWTLLPECQSGPSYPNDVVLGSPVVGTG